MLPGPVASPAPPAGPDRQVDFFDTLVELEAALPVRAWAGWQLLSAGSVHPGRWWAEFERPAAS